MYSKLSLVVLAFTAAACIKIRDPKKDEQGHQNAPQAVPEIAYKIEPLPQPNRYLVKFTGLGPEALVQRSGTNAKGKVEVQSIRGAEDEVDKGGYYEYEVQLQGRLRKVQVQVPTDVVIEGIKKLSDFEPDTVKTNVQGIEKRFKVTGRLYFREGSALVTDGQKVLIEADWIESEGARIQTFADSDLQVYNKDGASGGVVYLKGRVLRGNLEVQMRGQTGIIALIGQGMRNQGYNGGNSGQLYVDIADQTKGTVQHVLQPGAAGPGQSIVACHYQGEGKPCRRTVIKPVGPNGMAGVAQKVCNVKAGKCD